MSAALAVVISEAGLDDPKRIPANGIDCSWRINARGDASIEIETSVLRATGLLDCEGFGLSFRIQKMGLFGYWSGVIQQIRFDGASGTTEIAAQTNEALLDARRTAKSYDVTDGDAGGIAAKVIADNGWEGSAFIAGYRIGPTGLADISIRAEQVVDAIDQLAALVDGEWRVTWDRWFEFADRLGVDRTATVVLLEGRDVGATWEIIRDVRPRVNDLLAMSGVDAYTRKTAVVVLDSVSIEEIGQRQGAIVFPYLIKESLLRPAAKKELQRLARLGRGATLDVLDTHGAWSAFAEGDTVRLRLPSVGLTADLRVMVRTYSSSSDQLTISGEWVAA